MTKKINKDDIQKIIELLKKIDPNAEIFKKTDTVLKRVNKK